MSRRPATVYVDADLRAGSTLRSFDSTVIVAVTAVRMVQVAAHEIVSVASVRHTLVAAVGPVHVVLLVGAACVVWCTVRPVCARGIERVFVHMVAVNVMQVAIVQIVRVPVVLHRHVAASRSVRVRVSVVLLALLSHSPLLSPIQPSSSCDWLPVK